jgi:monooxygenase
VIGSGATAVTIVPDMARNAAHVVMLQRSPTYMVSRPSEDAIANGLRKLLPAKLAYGITRWKNVLLQMFFFRLARSRPAKVKEKILEGVRDLLPAGYDVERHFSPTYNPWDQRLCLVPDADMFEAISQERASIVTGTIERFTPNGILLASGEEIKADIIVTATGLKIQLMSDIAVALDGKPHSLAGSLSYKAMMFGDVPNLSYTFGYTNASWTLKADLTAAYLCRLLGHMDDKAFDIATPRTDPAVERLPFLDFTSGYVQRARDILPTQGAAKPWRVHQNYALDMAALKFGGLEDGVMEFRRADVPARAREAV